MTTIATDLRNTRESARRIRYEPSAVITATDIQSAIDQVPTAAKKITTTAITFGLSPYAPSATDTYLLVDTSGGAVTINLPAAASRGGLPLVIKDDTGNAVANPISVVPNGVETIDGLAAYPIDSAFAAATFNPQTGGYFVGP